MELDRVGLGGLVAVALVGDHVDEGHRAGWRSGLPEGHLELLEVVAVHRAQVLEPHLGPEHCRLDEAREAGIEPLDEAVHQLARGHSLGQALHAADHRGVLGMRDHPLAPVREEPDVLRDGHPVVVEHDDELLGIEVHDVVERLEAGAGGHRSVPDDGDGPRVEPAVRRALRDSQGDRKSCTGVARAQRVVRAFERLSEPGQTALQADVLELVAPAGHQLVRVGLVGRVPDYAVRRAVEDAVQRQRELDDPQVRGEMAATLGYDGDDGVPRFPRDLVQLLVGQPTEVARRVYPV